MKMTVDFYDFKRAFKDANREDNFTPDGLEALFDHLEQYEADTGEEIELDVISICCDYTEYENFEELNKAYSIIDDDEIAELLEDNDIESLEDITNDMLYDVLCDHTWVAVGDYGIIMQDY